MSSRIIGMLLCGLTLASVVACHKRSVVGGAPAPEEQVNVGYGEQSKAQTGGAVQSATAEQLSVVKASQVEAQLEGRFAGVDVIRTRSGGFLIVIRGGSTFGGSQTPLYVIDGIAVEVDPQRGLDWLSPASIARIDILKGPETTMYGARGANGVILITTKH